jgi:glycosyltransferase involved in cell wall biosynthesis|tara:strand:- start:792 stop:1676 length:885 start_codon:yes stop_codon:yes gene_type:complete
LSTLVCIPAFNEEKIIGKIVEECLKYSDQVVICDDGSIDKTFEEAELAGAICLKHKKNLGKGAALRSLFDYAKNTNFDIIVTIDGDGQFLPEEIPKLKKPIEDNGVDIVIGNRFSDMSEMPNYRKFGNKVLDKMTNLASELSIEDSQSGYRAYSKKSIEEIKFDMNGFGSDAEILIDAAKKGFRISEEKVKVIYNTGMKTSTKNPITHSGEVITSLLEIIAIKSPLKFMGIPGSILLAMGIIFAINVASVFNETGYFSIPYTMGVITFFVIGSMLLLIAVLLFSISRISTKNQT